MVITLYINLYKQKNKKKFFNEIIVWLSGNFSLEIRQNTKEIKQINKLHYTLTKKITHNIEIVITSTNIYYKQKKKWLT